MDSKRPIRTFSNLKSLTCEFFKRGQPFWRWLVGLPLLLILIWYVVAYEGAFFSLCKADLLRIVGWLLQVGGIAMVAMNLSSTARGAGQPSIRQWVTSYLASFPSLRTQVHNLKGVHLSIPTATAKGKAQVIRKATGSSDERIAMLEDQFRVQEELVKQLRSDLRAMGNKLGVSINEERDTRVQQVTMLQETIRQLVLGGIHIEWVGVVLLLIGVTLGTVSPELVYFYHGSNVCS